MSSKKNAPAQAAGDEKAIDIKLPALNIATFNVKVRGITTLITHQFSNKSKRQMADKQGGVAKMKKPPKVPEDDFNGAMYIDSKGRDCVPIIAFKSAMVSAARFADDLKMTVLRGAMFVEHPEGPQYQWLPIKYRERTMREDVVRVGMGTADLRYRPEYHDWTAEFIVRINKSMLTPEQVLNLINLAGFGVGICEWRPECNGPHGRFEVAMN